MTTAITTTRHAALLLRYAAQVLLGENQTLATRGELERVGYDKQDVEAWADELARQALGMAEMVQEGMEVQL